MHYYRWITHGDPLGGNHFRVRQTPTCSIEGCGKKSFAFSLCAAHDYRRRKHGSPLAGGTPAGAPEGYLKNVVLQYLGDECLIWPYAKDKNGYAIINGYGPSRLVSRISCEEENGPPQPNDEAAHLCGKGHQGCVSRKHLSWKSSKENAADRTSHGTEVRGHDVPCSKLTEDDVRIIRSLRGTKPQREIGRDFNVNPSVISRIFSKEIWGWLE